MSNDWLSSRETAAALLAAGLPYDELDATVFKCGRQSRMLATAAGFAHKDGARHKFDDRAPVPASVWRAMERCLTREDAAVRSDWVAGSFSFGLPKPAEMEMTILSTHFDRIGVESLAREIRRREATKISDAVLLAWLTDIGEQNSTKAFTRHRAHFGDQAVKRTHFMEVWRLFSGPRTRGRIPNAK